MRPKPTIKKCNLYKTTTNPVMGYSIIKLKHDNHKNINLQLIKHVGYIKTIIQSEINMIISKQFVENVM